MSQFIRSDINIISRKSRPHSGMANFQGSNHDVSAFGNGRSDSEDPLLSEGFTDTSDKEVINTDELDLKLQTLSHNNIYGSEQVISRSKDFLLVPNNTLSGLGANDTPRSLTYRRSGEDELLTNESLVFHSAKDFISSFSDKNSLSYELDTEPLNDLDVTRSTSLNPLISTGNQSHLSTVSSVDFSVGVNEDAIREVQLQTAHLLSWKLRLLQFGVGLINKFRKREKQPDLESQPLLEPSQDSPNYTDAPSDEADRGLSPIMGPLTRYFIENSWLFYVLVVIVTILIGVYVLLTGDYRTLVKIIRGFICYVLGSSTAATLFGDDFCPSFYNLE